MKKVLTTFVQCPCCRVLKANDKVLMPVKPRYKFKNKYLYNFMNGVRFQIPLCCVIYFCLLLRKTNWPAGYVLRKSLGVKK